MKIDKSKLTSIKFQRWQVKKLIFWVVLFSIIATSFLTYASWSLYEDKIDNSIKWVETINHQPHNIEFFETISKKAKQVSTGVYVESIKELNKKQNYYRLVLEVWFSWDNTNDEKDLDMINNFRFYNGYINKIRTVEDSTTGNLRYQRCRVDVTVNHNFHTKAFPLETHQLYTFLEPDLPASEVFLIADANSTMNSAASIAGYDIVNYSSSIFNTELDTSFNEPGIEHNVFKSEFLTAIEVKRADLGLYLECFIALLGTTLWALITLYLCTFHKVDPLGMIPAALFGTVTNVMVGANQLSESLDLGLLIFVNALGILTIISSALTIININRIRTHNKDNQFAKLFGQTMFALILYFVILGHIVLPLAAYL